jgi:putative acetyltransferase
MADETIVSIEQVDPRIPEVTAMIRELDRYMGGLYPAESNHLMDIDALVQSDVRFFGAQVNGAYRACGAIKLYGQDYAEVKRVYVMPTTRGLGLGRRIVATLEETARREGFALLRLETGISQPEALALFEACGFQRRPAFGDYPADDPYSVFMEKHLV